VSDVVPTGRSPANSLARAVNIDYDYLKDLIKHQTTSGTNKAVSIPGQGTGSTEKAFGETFLRVLQAQHDRINLFARSKSGEIERRLEHIGKSIEQLRSRRSHEARLPARTVERYAKIDADVARYGKYGNPGKITMLTFCRTAEEIRSLSRFIVVQRTGFAKILKKYKRWTKDRELPRTFRDEISSRPDSLFQLDLGYLLDQYIGVLGALRAVFDSDNETAARNGDIDTQLPAARITKALEHDDHLDLDLALSTVPLGAHGQKATYWVHSDHVVEVQVMLLQHMRLHTKCTNSTSRRASTNATPLRRRSSGGNTDRFFSNEDHIGLQVLDYAEAFAIKQNASTIGSIEEDKGNVGIKAAANVRFSAAAEAAIVVCTATDPRTQSAGDLKIAKLKRKFTEVFLDTSKPLPDKQNVRFVDRTGSFTAGEEETQSIRQWLTEHKEISPIAGVGAKRTRFAGLHNTSSGGIWATLDRDIFMKESLIKDLVNDDWSQTASSGAAMFPHAILEIRREGNQAGTLIQMLDRSHLVSLAFESSYFIPTNVCRSSASVVFRSKPMLYGLVAGQAPCLPLTGSLFLTKTFANYQNQ
jgi:SPX domain protein involved in polyphosphate accumulation